MGVVIRSIGYYLPERIVTNEELLEIIVKNAGNVDVDVNDLRKKLQINHAELRHFKSPDESISDMGEKAARSCLDKAGVKPQDLDLIIYGAMFRDYLEPAMSVVLQYRLGANEAVAFDLLNACNGFLSMMELASIYLEAGIYRNILLVSSENCSQWIPWELFGDRTTTGFSALTIADGAAAMLLQKGGPEINLKFFDFHTYGQYHDLCQVKLGKRQNDLKLIVKSKKLAMIAMEIMSEFVPRFLSKAIEHLGDLDIWFCHQVTGDQHKFYGGIGDELYQKSYITFSKVGNTGSISIPLGMAMAEEGRLKRGDRVAVVMGASGFICGGTMFIY